MKNKTIIFAAILLLINNLTYSQVPPRRVPYNISTSISPDQNYIVKISPRGKTDLIYYFDKNGSSHGLLLYDGYLAGQINLDISVQYIDGLGRPMQTVQKGVTPAGKDLVTFQEYDKFGRDAASWLPVALEGNNGSFVELSKIKSNTLALYPSETAPYSKPVYEESPLNRVLKQFGSGADWHNNDKAIGTNYKTNIAGDVVLNCIRYYATGTKQNPTLIKNGNYSSGQLYAIEMKDEDGNTSYEFKDNLGQVLLTRQMNGTELHDTYYVYNDYGNLCFVLPPRISDEGTTQNKLDELAYQYKYDNKGRCISKKIPGCDWINYVYDGYDNLIFTQDGEMRAKGEWMFTIPDTRQRPVLTGICKKIRVFRGPAREIEAGCLDPYPITATFDINAGSTYKYYAINAYLTIVDSPTILSVNYYDNYTFSAKEDFTRLLYNKNEEANGFGKQYVGESKGYEHKGLLTGTITSVINTSGSPEYIYSAMYYDNRDRLIQTKSTNHLGGIEEEYIAYNFTGQPTQRKHVHSATGKNTQAEVYAYTYDHAGRLTKTTHQLTDGATVKPPVTLAENSYDELGRLKTNKKGGRTELNTTYAYNVRSWTTKIESPLFTQNLAYNTLISGVTANAQWNGNISSMSWTVQGDTERKYGFVYDNLSRLKDANYVGAGSYTTNYTYDKHGNIKTLKQYGKKEAGNAATSYGLVDNLTMDHNGNQLTWTGDTGVSVSLSESADFKDKSTTRGTIEYTYNKNGALYSDLNKGITAIQYNSLNLPQQMVINSSTVKAKNYYTYSASGVKLRTEQRYDPTLSVVPVGSTTPANDGLSNYYTNTDYVGNIIYETEKKGATITNKTRMLVDGGYIENGVYYFYLTDHLGNNRVVANASGTPIQKNHYYPFGMAFAENTTQEQGIQPYKYNGKELDQMHGLNLYDYSARYYEPAIGRFTTVDPLAEKYYSISPYAYVGNNPLKFIDPTGMDWVYRVVDGIHEVYYDRSVTSQDDVNKKYGKEAGVTHLSDGAQVTTKDSKGNIISQYTFTNDSKENKYGTVTDINGEIMDNSQIIYGNNYTIFGTSDNSVNAETLHKNMMGTSYTGPDNPRNYLDQEDKSYQYKPRNLSEYYSIYHDKAYDAAGAHGERDALFNHSLMGADYRLAKGNLKNMVRPGVPMNDRVRSAKTALAFGFIATMKWLTKGYQTGSLAD